MKKLIALIITVLVFYPCLFHPMKPQLDQPPSEENALIGFEIFFNNFTIFNHKTSCSLALLNHYSNQQIKNTAHLRKKLLLNDLGDKNPARLVWHIHGGAYAYITHSLDPKSLIMNYAYLSSQHIVTILKDRWENEPDLLLAEHPIFFNTKGDACYYASGIMQTLGRGRKREIIEYSLSIDNKSKTTRCVLGRINKRKEFRAVSLAYIAQNSFLDLTRAIMHSSQQYELSTAWHKDRVKVFHWDGVAVPTRYLDSPLYLDSTGKPIKQKQP